MVERVVVEGNLGVELELERLRLVQQHVAGRRRRQLGGRLLGAGAVAPGPDDRGRHADEFAGGGAREPEIAPKMAVTNREITATFWI
jgi:hypothetical protein